MGRLRKIKEQAHKAAAGAAGVALATSGLSSCNDNGAVDPLPPPLQCNTVNMGQTLVPSAAVSDSIVTVTIENQSSAGLWSDSLAVKDPVGARVLDVSQPGALTRDPLVVSLAMDPPSGTDASFTLVGELQGVDLDRCSFTRTYDISVSGGTVTIGLAGSAGLPLLARQRADITIARREGHTVYLEARTPYRGPRTPEWTSTHGELNASGDRATWRLPDEPGLYQVELLMDYGDDGFAFDVLTLEIT